jgi:hypothetical protein
MLRALVVAAAGLALAPAGAHAQLPAPQPPPMAPFGIDLKWPTRSDGFVFERGQTLAVSVDSPRRKARLSLVAVDAAGTPTRAIARRTLRRGTFKVTIPSAGTFALRMAIGDRRYWTWVRSEECLNFRGDSAEIRLHASSVAAGGSLNYDLVNTSDGCIGYGYGYSFERLQGDGTWARALFTSLIAFPAIGFTLPTAQSTIKTALIPGDLAPGTYRLVDNLQQRITERPPNQGIIARPPNTPVNRSFLITSAPFTIVAPNSQ